MDEQNTLYRRRNRKRISSNLLAMKLQDAGKLRLEQKSCRVNMYGKIKEGREWECEKGGEQLQKVKTHTEEMNTVIRK